MKINRLETHDRLLQFQKQASHISKGCEDCIANRPKEFLNYPFYIFAHKRTIEMDERIAMYNQDVQENLMNPIFERRYKSIEDVPTARQIWSPRLTKPKAQENSMLFKAYPPGDNIKVIWMIPDTELWGQYDKDKMMGNQLIAESIYDFKHDRMKLEHKEEDDLPDSKIDEIYKEISRNSRYGKQKVDTTFSNE
jgi:hypothetical protein